MKRMLGGLALALVASAFAQPPTHPPPYTTPPAFPESQLPPSQMPPDMKVLPPQTLSTTEIQQQIQDKLNSEPALANTTVAVKADDMSVTLIGTMETEQQHDIALRIAQSYAGDRKIVDKIKLVGRT